MSMQDSSDNMNPCKQMTTDLTTCAILYVNVINCKVTRHSVATFSLESHLRRIGMRQKDAEVSFSYISLTV
jgi:hypothetical protein